MSEEFNMSQEIRKQLESKPDLTGKECLDAVKAANPGVDVNEKSFSTAFSVTRKKLGLASGGKKAKKKTAKKTASAPANGAAAANGNAGKVVDVSALQHAAKFLRDVGGSTEDAIAAVKAVSSLQLTK